MLKYLSSVVGNDDMMTSHHTCAWTHVLKYCCCVVVADDMQCLRTHECGRMC